MRPGEGSYYRDQSIAAVELVWTSLQSCCHCFWWWAGELKVKWEKPGTRQNKKTTEACTWLSSFVFHVVGNLQKMMPLLIGLYMYPAQDLENWRSGSDSCWRSCGLELCSMPTWQVWKSAEIPMCYPVPDTLCQLATYLLYSSLWTLRLNLTRTMKSSLGTHEGLVPGPSKDINIHGCSHPLVGPLCSWALHLWIQQTADPQKHSLRIQRASCIRKGILEIQSQAI